MPNKSSMKIIKYNGYSYYVSWRDNLRLLKLRTCLNIRRIRRWFHLLKKSDVLLLLVLTLIWVLFGVVFYNINSSTNPYDSLANEFYYLKEEYISSVIIVFFIAWFNRVTNYTHNNKEQHWIYQSVLDSLNALYKSYYGEYENNYLALYCDETIATTQKLVINNNVPIGDENIRFMSRIASERLAELRNYYHSGKLLLRNKYDFELYLYDCEAKLLGIIYDKRKYHKTYLEDLIISSQSMLDELRYIWRKDNDIHFEIIKVLINNGNTLLEDFYKRMYIYPFDQIKEYLEGEGLIADLSEKDFVEIMNCLGVDTTAMPDYNTFLTEMRKQSKARKGRLL